MGGVRPDGDVGQLKTQKENIMNIYTTTTIELPNAFPGNKKYNFARASNNGTLISVILDESGSMRHAQSSTIAGFNEFVQGQKATEGAGRAYLTVTKLNAPHIHTLYKNKPIENVEPLTERDYQPSGGTNLNDAIGAAIMNVDSVLKAVPESERPGVIIVIMTDGEENASREYTNAQIKEMVAAGEAADYTFLFLGANIDAFSVGSAYGMSALNTVSYNTNDMVSTMSSISASTSAMRGGKFAGMNTQQLYASGTTTAGWKDTAEDTITTTTVKVRGAKKRGS